MTATNPNVNIVQWFGDDILRLLRAAACIRRCRSMQSGTCTHSAIRLVFIILSITRIHLCLRQLTKEQLVSVLPLLLSRLEVVVYTCAAVALDRILSMRVGGSTTLVYTFVHPSRHLGLNPQVCMFSSADVQPFMCQLLDVLFAKIGIAQP